MKLIPRLSDFPFSLLQADHLWCIAACVEVVLDYYGFYDDCFQSKFIKEMKSRDGYNFITTLSVLKHLKKKNWHDFDKFSFETESLDLDTLFSKIKVTIDHGAPIITTIPVSLGAHAIVVVGYSEDNSFFAYYDPEIVQDTYLLLSFEELRNLIPDGRDYLTIKRNEI